MNQQAQVKATKAVNPATGAEIGFSDLHSVDQLKAQINQARSAQKDWAALSIKGRSKYLLKIRDFLVENIDSLSETISADNGKTRVDALATEVLPAAMATNYYCKQSAKLLAPQKLKSGNIALVNKRSKIVRVPYGVVGIISPWNYPFAIAYSEVIMGLIAGNAVILKTASETQMVGLALKKAVEAAQLPEHVFSYINLPGRIAGDAFLENGIDKLFFTGSVPVGKKLMAKAAENLIPVNLELGGNDAMIVCEDADLYRAAGGAVWAGYSNAGQSCGGVERIYVHESVYEPFLKILKEKTERLRIGQTEDLNCDMGVMTTEKQVNTVVEHINDAVQKGATIFAQSPMPSDAKVKNLHPAVVLTDVNHDMEVMKHETFGPVVGVMKYKTTEEAIALANDSYLGLTGSVWSKKRGKAERIARQIKAGAITINDHLMSHGLAETPWGGFKQSGIGRTHGPLGLNEMTQPQVIIHDILPGVKKNMWWPPYSADVYRGLKALLYFLYGKGLRQRIKNIFPLVKTFLRTFSK